MQTPELCSSIRAIGLWLACFFFHFRRHIRSDTIGMNARGGPTGFKWASLAAQTITALVMIVLVLQR